MLSLPRSLDCDCKDGRIEQADGAQQGQRRSHAAALWHGLITPFGVLETGIGLYRSSIVPGGALPLSIHSVHTGAGLTQESCQWVITVGQWLVSQTMLFVVGGDFHVKTVNGCVQSAVSRGACEATTQISEHTAPRCRVKIVVSTRLFEPRKLAMNRRKPWPSVRPSGCIRSTILTGTRCGLHAGWLAFIDAVEEMFLGGFLMAPDGARASCGRSQGQQLVWEACTSPWCDIVQRGSHGFQSWRRRSRICKHAHTARQ